LSLSLADAHSRIINTTRAAVKFYTPLLGPPDCVKPHSHAIFGLRGPRFLLDATGLHGHASARKDLPNGYALVYVGDLAKERKRLLDTKQVTFAGNSDKNDLDIFGAPGFLIQDYAGNIIAFVQRKASSATAASVSSGGSGASSSSSSNAHAGAGAGAGDEEKGGSGGSSGGKLKGPSLQGLDAAASGAQGSEELKAAKEIMAAFLAMDAKTLSKYHGKDGRWLDDTRTQARGVEKGGDKARARVAWRGVRRCLFLRYPPACCSLLFLSVLRARIHALLWMHSYATAVTFRQPFLFDELGPGARATQRVLAVLRLCAGQGPLRGLRRAQRQGHPPRRSRSHRFLRAGMRGMQRAT
jgi:hypothetical protein